jgi:hypothetical protein
MFFDNHRRRKELYYFGPMPKQMCRACGWEPMRHISEWVLHGNRSRHSEAVRKLVEPWQIVGLYFPVADVCECQQRVVNGHSIGTSRWIRTQRCSNRNPGGGPEGGRLARPSGGQRAGVNSLRFRTPCAHPSGPGGDSGRRKWCVAGMVSDGVYATRSGGIGLSALAYGPHVW